MITLYKSLYKQNTLLETDEGNSLRTHSLSAPSVLASRNILLIGTQGNALPSPSLINTHLTKDLVYGSIRGQCAVKYRELSLESLGYIIASTPWMDHGCQKLNVHNAGKLPRLL